MKGKTFLYLLKFPYVFSTLIPQERDLDSSGARCTKHWSPCRHTGEWSVCHIDNIERKLNVKASRTRWIFFNHHRRLETCWYTGSESHESHSCFAIFLSVLSRHCKIVSFSFFPLSLFFNLSEWLFSASLFGSRPRHFAVYERHI